MSAEKPRNPSEEFSRIDSEARKALDDTFERAQDHIGLDAQIDSLSKAVQELYRGEIEQFRQDQMGAADYETMGPDEAQKWKERANSIIAHAEQLGTELSEAIEKQQQMVAEKMDTLKAEKGIVGDLDPDSQLNLKSAAELSVAAERTVEIANENAELGIKLVDKYARYAEPNGDGYDLSRLSADELDKLQSELSELKTADVPKDIGGFDRVIHYPPGEDHWIQANPNNPNEKMRDPSKMHDLVIAREAQYKALSALAQSVSNARFQQGQSARPISYSRQPLSAQRENRAKLVKGAETYMGLVKDQEAA